MTPHLQWTPLRRGEACVDPMMHKATECIIFEFLPDARVWYFSDGCAFDIREVSA